MLHYYHMESLNRSHPSGVIEQIRGAEKLRTISELLHSISFDMEFVNNTSFSSAYDQSPFTFKCLNVNFVALYVGGPL